MITADHISLQLEQQQLLSSEQAWHYKIIPKNSGNDFIELYVDQDSFNDFFLEELEMLFGKRIIVAKVQSSIVQKTLNKYYRQGSSSQKSNNSELSGIKSENFLSQLIGEAKNLGSSDIHIESYEEKCRIRYRIDGLLIEKYSIPKEDYPSLINKIKIKANLDIAEKRLPQDGRIFFKHETSKFDIRVSALPTLHGEKIVLRLLNNDATNIDIEELGFTKEEIKIYLEAIKKPNGIILISGPTGSGKTTTLYATLKLLNKLTTNILTIEDPIEYTLEGINQTQLKENIGLTFSSALRTFLRQDPDIIMLGEIRDGETAQMAIRAALTGHLILSTIHTNSAWGTVSRLIDMGVPPFLVANTLTLSVAQRLVRKLCSHCKKEEDFNEELYPIGFKPFFQIKKHNLAVGCENCYYTGYKGRKAIYELLPINNELAENIKVNNLVISEYLKSNNIRTLSFNAFELLEKGETSIEEVYPILMNTF